jgi:extracellular factor (EF) 3-hydroxypalmitic acid methyl ester biosynthesis protein
VRFRPTRLSPTELSVDVACTFRCDAETCGPWPVLDLGSAGIAIATPDDASFTPGSTLAELSLFLGHRQVWTGDATVVHASRGRLGARFDARLVDLSQLRVEATLQNRLDALDEQRGRLPAEWRAAVSDVRQLLEDAKLEVELIEREGHEDPLRRAEEEAELFARLRVQWGGAFYAALASLHGRSLGFDERQRTLARAYASSALMPILYACPMHRRAFDKPLGYAGDYRMMELCFAKELTGDGKFGRFLQSVALGYPLVQTVAAREAVMREAVRAIVEEDTLVPARILALAAGPAVELRRLLEGPVTVRRPVEIVLLDQDRGAHETAHAQLTRLLVERHHGALPVTVTCVHFSIRQLLKPQTPEEREVAGELVRDLDLTYSAGLYDYLADPVATRLTHFVYERTRPGGRVLVGNLESVPDITFMLDFVLDWQLQYRTPEGMLRLAKDLFPAPSHAGITRDGTGHCLFLDATKPR